MIKFSYIHYSTLQREMLVFGIPNTASRKLSRILAKKRIKFKVFKQNLPSQMAGFSHIIRLDLR